MFHHGLKAFLGRFEDCEATLVVGISAINSISSQQTTSGQDSASGLSAKLQLSRTCDRSTMEHDLDL